MSEDVRPEDHTRPSKSQRKREAKALFDLGSDLVRLDQGLLSRMPLPDDVLAAVRDARAIKSHGARKRQLQFLGGLLRRIDPEPIIEAMDELQAEGRRHAARFHRVEAWRDRLLADGDAAVRELVTQRPGLPVQPLRQLLRNAAREADQGRPPAAARKLFRLLRDLDAGEALPPT